MDSIDFSVIEGTLRQAGAIAVSALRADSVAEEDREVFKRWIDEEMNAGMDYMKNWPTLRFDPREMHPGTRWIICCAFSYASRKTENSNIASYALGDDYHKVIPKRLREALRRLKNGFVETARICVDSAPVRERYWAVRSGLADRCDSGLVSIPGYGTKIFLTEILTPWELTGVPEKPEYGFTKSGERVEKNGCDHCGACVKACPGGAILAGGRVDARKCISYLTIEKKGDWTVEERQILSHGGSNRSFFGCEICQKVCHLNQNIPETLISEFSPRPELMSLTPKKIGTMSEDEFLRLTRNSPLRRSGLESLRRNVGPGGCEGSSSLSHT